MPKKVPTNVGWFPNCMSALSFGFFQGVGFNLALVFFGFKYGKFGFSFDLLIKG
jgi:hypothetical protein